MHEGLEKTDPGLTEKTAIKLSKNGTTIKNPIVPRTRRGSQ